MNELSLVPPLSLVPLRYVLDASAGFKWVVAEPLSDKANRLRDDYRNAMHELLAPTFSRSRSPPRSPGPSGKGGSAQPRGGRPLGRWHDDPPPKD